MLRTLSTLAFGAGTSLAALPTAAQVAAPAETDDIVVTGDRTDRTLRQTPASVVVSTGADVDRLAGTYSVDDVISRIPNIVTTRPSNNAPAIRGVDGTGPQSGGDAFFGGTRPRVNFQVDNRTLTFNEVIFIDGLLWDVQQIEAYRGPQSTLQGRNAVAGVIAVKTNDPTDTWSGRARAVVGDYGTRQFSGALGGPIVPGVLSFRVAADWREEQAFVDFAPYQARAAGLSTELKQIDNPGRFESFTARGKLLFTPSSDVRALLTLSHSDAYAPQTIQVARPFRDHVASFPEMPRMRTRADVAIADADMRIADGLTLALLGSATDFRILRYAMLDAGSALIDGREYSAEPRLKFGGPGDRLSGFLAGLIFRARQREEIDFFTGRFRDRTNTDAVFGEVTFRPDAVLGVTLGLRYEEERRLRTGSAGPFVTDFDRTFRAFLPRATVTLDASPDVTIGATIARGYNAGGVGFAFDPPFPSYTYDKETVTNYEAFGRASLADGRLQLRGNAFFNRYRGLQLPFDLNPDPNLFAFVTRNAERATTYGLEVESRYRALPELSLFANAGLLETKVDRFVEPTVEGNELPRAPAFSLNAGFTLQPVPPLELSFDMRYSDSYYSDAFNEARGKTKPYTLANAQVAWRQGRFRIFAAATNLFDTTDAILLSPGSTRDLDAATITRPRRVTGGVEASF